jgi:sarcosine oxidase subunit beta
MTSMAAGELLAVHVMGNDLPEYALAFMLSRYDDPDYQKRYSL